MNLKTLLLLPGFLICFITAIAQKQYVYFLKNSGALVTIRDSADFIRIVSEPDSGTTLYNVKEYYKNEKPKFIGKASKVDPMTLQGECMSYYPTGKKKLYANYIDGSFSGDVYNYFPNGKLYTYEKYIRSKTTQGTGYDLDILTMACNDSTGKELVVNGDGNYIGYTNDFKNIKEEGIIKNGLKEGKWKGNNGYPKDYITFIEEYAGGKFISGQSTDKDNKTVNYTVAEREPIYPGGMQAFYAFLGNNIKYPEYARSKKITGRVSISFVVEKDGALTDLKVVKNPNDELSAEAVRVLKMSPKWDPGMQYGRPVRVQYTVPVNFALGATN